MSDEQTIYINPEDDLTTVRERLEQIPSHRIALVIPRQTQLRSHVAWHNLYRRAHELDKDVLIISSDAQIRSVAQAAQFRVAHPQQATSPTGRARAASRPGHRSATTRNRSEVSQSRSLSTRNAPNTQGARNGQNSLGNYNAYQGNSVADRSIVEREPGSRPPHEDDATTSGSISEPASSTFGDQHSSRPYNFRDTVPPITPLSPEHMLEEPDSLSEDFNQALDIRRAAMEGHEASKAQAAAESFQSQGMTSSHDEKQDPFLEMEDSLTPPIPEQRGSASVDFDADEYSIHGRSEKPMDIVDGEIEYQGDQGDFVIHSDTPETLPRSVSDPIPEDTQDTAGPAHTFPARRSRIRRSTQLPPQIDPESREAPSPVEEKPIQPTPSPSTRPRSRQLASASSSEQVSQQVPSERNRASPPRPVARQTSQQGAAHAGRATGTPVRPIAARRPTARRRGVGANSVLIALIILLLVLLGSLVYFGPSATVTLTLFSQNFSAPVKLVASASPAKGSVPGYLYTTSFTKSGTGTVTGTTKVGTAQATGTVTFTNNGADSVEIPTGTVVSTSTGVQFVTTTDVVAQMKTSSLGNTTIPISVQAVKQGESGNVPAGSITVIPDSSLSAIATYDKLPVTNLKLQVTNDAATSGGGVGSASSVTAADLKTAQAALHAQLATPIAAWVKSQLARGDVASNPTTIETVTSAPPPGQIVDAGTFPMTLSINVKVLVVRSATLQQASIAQLDDVLHKTQPGYIIAPDAEVTVTPPTTTGDANSLTLAFTATGKAVPAIDKYQVQSLIAGKSIPDAKSLLKAAQVENVAIQVSPSFITFVPWWTGHINVKIVPGTTR
ncbi:MAG: baseplate J/gp47 family protein [Ktedonobacteraceae bacterium]|nr:baseplate J/gp47 family protein [Ktedonobacteraceae bacterium]